LFFVNHRVVGFRFKTGAAYQRLVTDLKTQGALETHATSDPTLKALTSPHAATPIASPNHYTNASSHDVGAHHHVVAFVPPTTPITVTISPIGRLLPHTSISSNHTTGGLSPLPLPSMHPSLSNRMVPLSPGRSGRQSSVTNNTTHYGSNNSGSSGTTTTTIASATTTPVIGIGPLLKTRPSAV
jgi:hypothetical protein